MNGRSRKKSVRYRGSKTHGCGAMKKRRGAGNRGGRGNAGSGKKADSKKPSFWKVNAGGKDPAKRGFSSQEIAPKTINVGHLASISHSLVVSGHATQEGDAVVINLKELGYGKLLGAGHVARKIRVDVALATPGAKSKIEAAGGSLAADMIADREAVIDERETRAKAERASRRKKPEGGAAKADTKAVAEE